MMVINVWILIITSGYSNFSVNSNKWLLPNMPSDLLCTAESEGHEISSRHWDDTVEVMTDEW